ncbi:GPR endopeptidase [Sporolactobacillus sp. CPB3-1]|uniref:Germination protease n=1 Tax=Sporolactobacillus mangiferae TaxID=2940498 RepID=A0ABT0M6D7_9BACL|nr:GPR endopeptidase [Sporolactobacillus mangiferae]MCL1630432.1 GPR endopeptidase [Sporolactobacillus mangiferae]
MNELDVNRFAVRTDLAVEASEQKPGIQSVQTSVQMESGIKITTMMINEQAAIAMKKKSGAYLTFEARNFRKGDTEFDGKAETIFARYFAQFLKNLKIADDASCLIVGLGNKQVTPDSLGPNVVDNILVTKHLFDLQPENVQPGYRSVSAITPGVMGLTGIETSDIILGVIERTKPGFVIAIDALAARAVDRVNTTIQVADSGIHPGSGVGNNRKELSMKTLGIPVIAIGVPTVVDAVTITSDSLDLLLRHLHREMTDRKPSKALAPSWMAFGEKINYKSIDLPSKENRAAFLGMVGTLTEDEKAQLIREALGASGMQMMVTPKEVDFFIEKMANVIAEGLNAALHHQINQKNVGHFTH